MSIVKRNLKYLVVSTIALVLIVAGLIIFFLNRDDAIDSGIYFRRTYGFLGMSSDHSSILQLVAFNVGNQDLDFLTDIENISFGVEGIVITEIQVQHNQSLREVEYIDIIMNIQMYVPEAQLTHLVSPEGNFEIGLINLQQVDNSNAITRHGVMDVFQEGGLYALEIRNTNTLPIEIKELIFYHHKINNYEMEFELPITLGADMSMLMEMRLDFDIANFDIFELRPVISFRLPGQDEDSFFVPMMSTRHVKSMNYFEIKEYITNVKTSRS